MGSDDIGMGSAAYGFSVDEPEKFNHLLHRSLHHSSKSMSMTGMKTFSSLKGKIRKAASKEKEHLLELIHHNHHHHYHHHHGSNNTIPEEEEGNEDDADEEA